jgi:hypothetical protein
MNSVNILEHLVDIYIYVYYSFCFFILLFFFQINLLAQIMYQTLSVLKYRQHIRTSRSFVTFPDIVC